MDTTMQMQLFFFISSIGFIILGILSAFMLFYAISAFRSFARIMKVVERDIHSIGDTTKEMIEDVRESVLFRFLFQGKKRKHKK